VEDCKKKRPINKSADLEKKGGKKGKFGVDDTNYSKGGEASSVKKNAGTRDTILNGRRLQSDHLQRREAIDLGGMHHEEGGDTDSSRKREGRGDRVGTTTRGV